MQALVIWMKVLRQSLSSKKILRCFHESLSRPGVEELLQLDSMNLNSSSLENSGQRITGLLQISSRIIVFTCRLLAMWNVEWRAYYRSLISWHCQLLYLIVSITGSFFLLTQLISSHGPCFLLTISWILLSKKNHFMVLTLFLKSFQFSQLLKDQYMFRALLYSSFYQLLDCFVILIYFEFAFQAQLILEARNIIVSSSLKELLKSLVLMLLIACTTSSMNLDSSSLFFAMEYLNELMFSLAISILMVSGAWSNESWELRRMEWLLSLLEPLQRNMRSMVELEPLSVSKYLVGTMLVGLDSSKLKKSATVIRLS